MDREEQASSSVRKLCSQAGMARKSRVLMEPEGACRLPARGPHGGWVRGRAALVVTPRLP